MRHVTLLAAGLLTLSGSLSAQRRWSLTLERGSTTFSEAGHDTGSPPVRVIPWHPAVYALRLARDGPHVGVALGAGLSAGELGGVTEGFAVLPGSQLVLVEIAPEARFRIVTSARGGRLAAHLGPILDLWFPEGDDYRWAWGGLAGFDLTAPVTGRWELSVRADLAITGSEISRGEVKDGLIRARTMRRGRLALGITRTL